MNLTPSIRRSFKDVLAEGRMQSIALLIACGVTRASEIAARLGLSGPVIARLIADDRYPKCAATIQHEVYTKGAEIARNEKVSPIMRDHVLASKGRTLLAGTIQALTDEIEKSLDDGGVGAVSASKFREAINAYRASMDHAPDIAARRRTTAEVHIEKAVFMDTPEQAAFVSLVAAEAGLDGIVDAEFVAEGDDEHDDPGEHQRPREADPGATGGDPRATDDGAGMLAAGERDQGVEGRVTPVGDRAAGAD